MIKSKVKCQLIWTLKWKLIQCVFFPFVSNLTILDKFNLEMKQNEIYSENSKTVAALIQEMAIGKIVKNGKW